jgi:hypothetical protein
MRQRCVNDEKLNKLRIANGHRTSRGLSNLLCHFNRCHFICQIQHDNAAKTTAPPSRRWHHIERFERGDIGPELFKAACQMGLEALGIEAPGSFLSRRPVAAPGEDKKSRLTCNEPRKRCDLVALDFPMDIYDAPMD